MKMILAIIGIILCILVLSWITSKEKWDKMNRSPKGWIQYKGVRNKKHNLW
jgi:hypothetical protein